MYNDDKQTKDNINKWCNKESFKKNQESHSASIVILNLSYLSTIPFRSLDRFSYDSSLISKHLYHFLKA